MTTTRMIVSFGFFALGLALFEKSALFLASFLSLTQLKLSWWILLIASLIISSFIVSCFLCWSRIVDRAQKKKVNSLKNSDEINRSIKSYNCQKHPNVYNVKNRVFEKTQHNLPKEIQQQLDSDSCSFLFDSTSDRFVGSTPESNLVVNKNKNYPGNLILGDIHSQVGLIETPQQQINQNANFSNTFITLPPKDSSIIKPSTLPPSYHLNKAPSSSDNTQIGFFNNKAKSFNFLPSHECETGSHSNFQLLFSLNDHSSYSPSTPYQNRSNKINFSKSKNSIAEFDNASTKKYGAKRGANTLTVSSIMECSKNDLTIFFTPVPEIIRFFSKHESQWLLQIFYEKIINLAPHMLPSIVANLLRFPVRMAPIEPRIVEALCQQLLVWSPSERNLSTMQLALAAWSLAKLDSVYSVECGNYYGKNSANFKELIFKTMQSIASEAELCIHDFQVLSVANLMWACGKLKFKQNRKLIEQLANISVNQFSEFNAQNIANTYWSLGSLEISNTALTPELHTFQESRLRDLLLSKLSTFNSQATANFIWACAKLKWGHPNVIREAAIQIPKKINEFKPQEIANVMWGLAKLNARDTISIVRTLANHSAEILHCFNNQEVSNAYWALGTLEIHDSDLTPSDLTPCKLFSKTVESDIFDDELGFHYENSAAVTALPSSVTSTVETLFSPRKNPYELHSEVLESKSDINSNNKDNNMFHQLQMDKLKPSSRSLLRTLLKVMQGFNAQAIANLLWACARLQWKCIAVCEASSSIVIRNCRTFRPQNIANTLWALAKLKYRNTEMINALIECSFNHIQKFNTQELANIYWALGTLDLTETPFTCGIEKKTSTTTAALTTEDFMQPSSIQKANNSSFDETVRYQHSAVCEIIMLNIRYFKPQEVANFIWACARLGWRDLAILEESCVVASRMVGRFKSQETGKLIWGYAKLNFKPIELIETLCHDVIENIDSYTAHSISNIYWALGFLNIASTELTQNNPQRLGFVESLVTLMKSFDDQKLASFLWACAKLKWNEPTIMRNATKLIADASMKNKKQNNHLAFGTNLNKFKLSEIDGLPLPNCCQQEEAS